MLLKSSRLFLDELFRIKAIKVDIKDGFRLAKHEMDPALPLSPYFYNFRTEKNPKTGPLLQHHVDSMALEILIAAQRAKITFDAVAGVPRAGSPFALAIVKHERAQNRPVEYISLRKREGVTRRIINVEHKYRKSAARTPPPRVLIVDDLITSMTMKERAIECLRKSGFRIAGVAVYMDREEGGSKMLRKAGIPFAAAMTTTKALSYYAEVGKISAEEASVIEQYRQNA